MSNVMVTLTTNYSELFEVERTLFFTADEWDSFRKYLIEDPEELFPFTAEIGGEPLSEFEDGDEFLDACEVVSISDAEYDTLIKLFPDGIGSEDIEFPPYI